MILVGDVGGTNTRLAWCEMSGSRVTTEVVAVYASREYRSLGEIVSEFVSEHHRIARAASFGVAGPVRDGRSKISNLSWEVDREKLADLLGLHQVIVANDLEVTAYGIASLEKDDLVALNVGEPDPDGDEALIAAGTGLGEAGLHWEGDCHRPFASEGGHCDFASRDEFETELLLFLSREFGHVSYERVVSGPGLFNIYRFLRDSGRAEEPQSLTDEIGDEDPSPIVSRHGLSGRHPICVEALDRFVSLFGAETGNLALKLMATAGIFVGGGIAPKVLAKLRDGRFMEAFTSKGRMAPLLARVPVHVITNDRCALFGAARLADLRASSLEGGRS